ncbi:uncharacterized protein (TIRG00374 family) [Methanomicrobium sp. W14]|uniref:flippase-like domain-containing protein n=1 Tax=Methanomicrobium sp. W14 TaxID=2817839 RepID=UPI001AE204D5|nr:flippase-like domain-containing protein [Methanomicrobium sp. W14]MBP2134442.1 uncharacterized protein (TIRG00374 family) [Methanomicrobium sp. W14]
MGLENSYFISCIVPARNEEENLNNVVNVLTPVLANSKLIKNYEIIIVNDNSTDSTPKLIESLAKKDSHIHPVHRKKSPGFGNAVKAGMAEAKGNIIIPFMGDLSEDPNDIINLIKKIDEGYDIAYGSRFIKGATLKEYPFAKLISNRAFNNLVRYSFGISNHDVTNAFKAYRKEVLDAIGIENLESSGFDLTVEIPVKAYILGFRSVEVPVYWANRKAGEAKLKLPQNGIIFGKRFLKLFFQESVSSLKDLFHFFIKGSWLGILLALFFGALIIAFLLNLTGVKTIISLLTNANLGFILLSCLAILFSFFIRTWRWDIILKSAGYTHSRDILFRCIMFGWFLNYLIPARLGEIARAAALKINSDTPLGMTLSTIVIERILDVITLILFLEISSAFFYRESLIYVEIASFSILFIMFFILFVIYRYDKVIIKIFEPRIPSINQSILLIKEGLSNISKNPRAIFTCFCLSIPVWFFEVLSIFFAAKSIGYSLPFIYATFSGVVAFIAQTIPLTPAGLGIHEASITGVLMLFSVPSALGMSIALIDHVARGLVIFIFGIIATIHIAFASRGYFKKNMNSEDKSINNPSEKI